MCGRYFINTLPETLAEQFLVSAPADLTSNYNVAPSHQCPIVVTDDNAQRQLIHGHWGLIPFWAKDRKIGSRTINARLETASGKPAYRAAWKQRRCVVPASGYFEWVGKGSAKTPYAIVPGGQDLFALAGLWETWRDEAADDTLYSFTIMTTEAKGPASKLHHRMPLMLDRALQQGWLDHTLSNPESVATLVAGAMPTQSLSGYPVSRAVNAVRNNYPELLESAQLL